ncbi:MAG: hypothetical protein U0231_08405 [Nitrospiraceae bacterium]
MPDSTVLSEESLPIHSHLLEEAVPAIGFHELARSGALLCLSVNYTEIGRQAGQITQRLLDGHLALPLKPAPPDRLELSINLKTAKYLEPRTSRDREQSR